MMKVGALGKLKFPKGHYAYVGSALNNLEKRVERHLRKEKKIKWHIDYLLRKGKVKEVYYKKGNQREECKIARKLAKKFNSIKNFGSSDCQCSSHLFYSKDQKNLRFGAKLKEENVYI